MTTVCQVIMENLSISPQVYCEIHSTEVELLSFVCSTGGKGSKPRLWNIQKLRAVVYLCTYEFVDV